MGLFGIFTKTSPEQQAAKEEKQQRKLEEKIMNSAYAQDIDKQFNAVMRGADFECKERQNYTVWQPKLSETGSRTDYKQHDKSGGFSNGTASSGTSRTGSRATTSVESGKLGEENDHDSESR